MKRKRRSIIDRAIALLDPDDREKARLALKTKTPRERERIRRELREELARLNAGWERIPK